MNREKLRQVSTLYCVIVEMYNTKRELDEKTIKFILENFIKDDELGFILGVIIAKDDTKLLLEFSKAFQFFDTESMCAQLDYIFSDDSIKDVFLESTYETIKDKYIITDEPKYLFFIIGLLTVCKLNLNKEVNDFIDQYENKI